jgi:hypothetical protein
MNAVVYSKQTKYDVLVLDKLNQYLQSNLATIDGITYDSAANMVNIYSTSDWTDVQKQTIDALLESYSNPPQDPIYKTQPLGLQTINVNTTEYSLIYSFEFLSEPGWKLSSIRCKATSLNTKSFQIRVVDVSNNSVLCETSITNSIESNINLQLPNTSYTSVQTLELHAKVNDVSGTANILGATLVLEQELF